MPLALTVSVLAAGIVAARMSPLALERNSVLAAATVAYFTGVHSSRGHSPFGISRMFPFLVSTTLTEALVGFLFAAGCILPVLGRAPTLPPMPLVSLGVPAVFFALLGWANCHSINRWESPRGEGTKSGAMFPAGILAAIGLLLGGLLVPAFPRSAMLIFAGAGSAALLALLDRVKDRLTPLFLRAAADLVLLTPLALLLR